MRMGSFSLVHRITALVVGVCVVALVVQAVQLYALMAPLLSEMLNQLAAETRTVSEVLRHTDATRREEMALVLSNQRMRVSRTGPPEQAGLPTPPDHMPPDLRQAITQHLGADVALLDEETPDGGKYLHIGFVLAQDTWWIRYRLLSRSMLLTAMPIAVPVCLIALAATLATILGVRLITRPLSRLASDMLARRDSLTPIEAPCGSSVELQQVVSSFNDMVGALRRAQMSHSHLLAGVSHDLRTPLARLRLRTELVCPDHVLQAMEADFRAVTQIIDQFMAYAQGHVAHSGGRHDGLAGIVRQCVSRYAVSGQSVELAHLADVPATLPTLHMQRIVSNLIDNALSHGQGPVTVEVHGAPGGVEVLVFDHGRGIAAKDLSSALLPFTKLGGINAGPGHCGLGLAIVAQIAAMLGGRVVHRSFDGHRSAMGIFVPI